LIGLGGFSTYVLLGPAHSIALFLDIIDFTFQFKLELLTIAIINIVACFAFERYGEKPIGRAIFNIRRYFRTRKNKKDRHHYKAVDATPR
jgi:cation-transporting ATPase 13A3/4/5